MMFENVLIAIIILLSFAIVLFAIKAIKLMVEDHVQSHVQSNLDDDKICLRRTITKLRFNENNVLTEEIVKRMKKCYSKIENGEIKLEGLRNESDPHSVEQDIQKFSYAMSQSHIVEIILSLEDVGYCETY